MKALITSSGQFGPFTSIEQITDRWICDGTEYQFSVIGNATIGDYVPAQVVSKIIVPVSVSPRQIRQALTAAGLRTQIEMAISSADQDTKDWWEFATSFERAHPMVIAMATGLGVSTAELDELFILAGSL